MSDPIGQAISDFYKNGTAPDILINTNYTEGEILPPAYFFRTWGEMPKIEKTAIKNCQGKILDVGAAAGSHALELQKQGFDVTALEKSELAAAVMKKRGVEKVVCADVFHFKETGFDTILLLMNGTGIGQTIDGLKKMLLHLKSLLNEGGQMLIDSSDIHYLFEEEDGSLWIDLANDNYYGEMDYELVYKNHSTQFKWLFTDLETLAKTAGEAGLNCQLIEKGEQNDFLVRLTLG
ncbi:Methyltransferase domain-containing protein [Tangfeifania diversioriginum]|uniref:Methyltransferase domain-containing protein n=1 Tax=Tangfeifania diversioriginum TaxID=1168035 RepID=A0A1M6K8N2_9BACT|nr:methyltransferase domain-containing protein [Tangfeifania diversioriginum]SHJ55210.1 Methyltransferase domain-containing protein [Tangfeifania diversioriginum]